MLNKTLKGLGLSDVQVSVYLTLLSIGSSAASVLAKRIGMPRSTARYTCQQLSAKGVIFETSVNGTLIFTAKSPRNLHMILDKEEAVLSEKRKDLEVVMSELEEKYKDFGVFPRVDYYEGEQGIIDMLRQVLEANVATYGCFRLDDSIPEKVLKFFYKEYDPLRKASDVLTRSIVADNEITRMYRDSDECEQRMTLLVSNDEFPFEHCCHIYGDRVAFYSASNDYCRGVMIKDKNIATTQFSLFKMAWNYARSLDVNKDYRDLEL